MQLSRLSFPRRKTRPIIIYTRAMTDMINVHLVMITIHEVKLVSTADLRVIAIIIKFIRAFPKFLRSNLHELLLFV